MGQVVTAERLLEFLGGVEGFKEIPKAELEAFIIPLISIATYESGQKIITRGEKGLSLFVLYEGLGTVRMPLPDGETQQYRIEKGDVVGEMSLVSGHPAVADVIAERQSLVLTIDVETFQSLMINLWSVAKAFAGLIGSRLANRA